MIFSFWKYYSCPAFSFLQVPSPHRSPPPAHHLPSALQGGDRPSLPQSTRSASPPRRTTKRKWYVVFDLIHRSLVVFRQVYRELIVTAKPMKVHSQIVCAKNPSKGIYLGCEMVVQNIQSMCCFSTEGATETPVTTGRSTLERSTFRRESALAPLEPSSRASGMEMWQSRSLKSPSQRLNSYRPSRMKCRSCGEKCCLCFT